jgi:alkylation response protein AidB-like acyl-CoA dehydrogenase
VSDYIPPTDHMRFILESVCGLEGLPEHPDLGALDGDTVQSILEPAAQLASEVLAPINHQGDKSGATLKDGIVTTAPGWKEAYTQYCEGGWNAVPFDPHYGGQGLPWCVAFAVLEMWQAANMAFGLCPLLNQGAVEAIEAHGSDDQKQTYLEKLIAGEWTGTMNLTEPQAGSDLAAVCSKAVPQGDGTYKISGQKIFITYGEHDMADNIIHLVLARTPDAPEGVKGISLFIVPKILSDGTRNDVKCTGIEHKLGIHASPTCTMQFGDKGGATGYLIGQENEGLKYMFTMMNNARLSVGLQGVAIADRAYQHALSYAKDREQGASLNDKARRVAIADHADVKRMLLTMKALTMAGRALTYEAGLALDLARAGDATAQAKVDLMTPVVKAWCTDMAQEVTSLGVQVHGGMGFIEETGAAQFFRDARILPIYEGTNGIQAADLVFRKMFRDNGQAAQAWMKQAKDVCNSLKTMPGDDMEILAQGLSQSVGAMERATQTLLDNAKDLDRAAAASTPYLRAFGTVAGGLMMARSAMAAQRQLADGDGDPGLLDEVIVAARFYAENILPLAAAQAQIASNDQKVITATSL